MLLSVDLSAHWGGGSRLCASAQPAQKPLVPGAAATGRAARTSSWGSRAYGRCTWSGQRVRWACRFCACACCGSRGADVEPYVNRQFSNRRHSGPSHDRLGWSCDRLHFCPPLLTALLHCRLPGNECHGLLAAAGVPAAEAGQSCCSHQQPGWSHDGLGLSPERLALRGQPTDDPCY